MELITLSEAKEYLRVDSEDEDFIIASLLDAAGILCRDVARLSDEQWAEIDSELEYTDTYSNTELENIRSIVRAGVFYALGYMYEHREEGDHHGLTLTLRALLSGLREGVV